MFWWNRLRSSRRVARRRRRPPLDLGECVTVLVNAVARGMAQLVAPHDLTHIDFALLRLFLGVEEWTTTQLAQACLSHRRA